MYRYYREWMQECGWGVMLGFDTVKAYTSFEAKAKPVKFPYCENPFETITKVPKKFMNKTDEELGDLFDSKTKKWKKEENA